MIDFRAPVRRLRIGLLNASISLLLMAVPSAGYPVQFDSLYAVVFVDEETEAKYGDIPLDRALLAQVIERLANAGAKAVVLKFFIDREKNEAGDDALAMAMSRLPVILQARIEESEPHPNPLPRRFTLEGLNAKTSIHGASGWIPAKKFTARAYDIGFVDFRGFPAPILETYRGKSVKSLILSSLEVALGEAGIIKPGVSVGIGALTIPLNGDNTFDVATLPKSMPDYTPLHSVLEGDDWSNSIRNKVVVIGYAGPKIGHFPTRWGPQGGHVLFVNVLRSVVAGSSNRMTVPGDHAGEAAE